MPSTSTGCARLDETKGPGSGISSIWEQPETPNNAAAANPERAVRRESSLPIPLVSVAEGNAGACSFMDCLSPGKARLPQSEFYQRWLICRKSAVVSVDRTKPGPAADCASVNGASATSDVRFTHWQSACFAQGRHVNALGNLKERGIQTDGDCIHFILRRLQRGCSHNDRSSRSSDGEGNGVRADEPDWLSLSVHPSQIAGASGTAFTKLEADTGPSAALSQRSWLHSWRGNLLVGAYLRSAVGKSRAAKLAISREFLSGVRPTDRSENILLVVSPQAPGHNRTAESGELRRRPSQ